IVANNLQNSAKNARVVYASATGATEIDNFAYLQRLGLWGEGTQFVDEKDFITKIGRSGIAAMELVSRDMKAMGVYLARSISFDGVKYDKLNHNLTKDQKYMYDTMSEGWQVVVQNVEKAAQITGSANNTGAKQRINTVWGTMQNFYNAVLTSFSMPSVIKDIEKELKAGHSCVIQLVNTYEAAQEKAVAKMRKEGETDYDNLDLTPRQMLESYIMNAFPVQQYEEYLDEKGNKLSRPVTDSAGNPVLNKQAVRMRDDLLAQIKDISIPESPIDMLINHFGVEQVAEITGRKNRFINKTDENGDIKKVKDTRDSQKANIAETKDFQDGKKRILVFSEAGATGRSYHADKRAKNQQPRIHYILQPGWRADKAVQSTGRTHRSNQANTPTYKLVSTDVAGQKRFVTSVARRLEQLGALTKGQRQTGSGIFDASDNMESDLSREALRDFYKKLGAGQLEGIDPVKTLKGMGLYRKFYDEYGVFKLNETVASDIPQFLNRVLALKVDEDNRVFQAYENIRQAYYDAAIEAGTLDTGMENVKADKIEIGQEETVYTDESTGAETKYIRALVYNKPSVIESVEDARVYSPNFVDIRRMEDGSVRAVYRIADQTDNFGRVSKRYRLQSPNTAVSNTMNERNLEAKAEKIPAKEWESAWKEAVHDVPEYNENEVHMITGALLPIWNRLPSDGTTKARRITTADGSQYLGRIIPPKQIDTVLRSFDVKGDNKVYTGNEIYDAVMKKAQTVVFNGQYGGTLTVSRRRVSGENRMEVTGGNLFTLKQKYPDMITENIQFQNRYFIPSGEKGVAILSDMIDTLKVRSIGKDSDGDIYYKRKSAKETVREGKEYRADTPPSLDDLKITAEKMFNLPINYGKTGGKAGLYKTKEDTIRVAQ
ncbi:MAG: strawberry notch C-terminal domain-containing protein, partial [Clostridia bacterium]|nr:strawberry notch C-terminal domain-containing protein [Clostridia bacterium]